MSHVFHSHLNKSVKSDDITPAGFSDLKVMTDCFWFSAAVDTTSIEDQILDNQANLHSSPSQDVAEMMAQIRNEEELERLKLIKAMRAMKSKAALKKPPKK